jgi:hypothetical protein
MKRPNKKFRNSVIPPGKFGSVKAQIKSGTGKEESLKIHQTRYREEKNLPSTFQKASI